MSRTFWGEVGNGIRCGRERQTQAPDLVVTSQAESEFGAASKTKLVEQEHGFAIRVAASRPGVDGP
jgi:hypothetical protein